MTGPHPPHASPDELAHPRVRPCRAVPRVLPLLALALIASLILWKTWDARTRRGVETRADDYRRRGEPTRVADFASPPLPPERDALIQIRLINAALPTDNAEFLNNFVAAATTPLDAPTERRARAFLKATAPALARLPAVLACPAATWRLPVSSTARPGIDLDEDYEFDRWVNVLVTFSTIAHRDGDDDAALARVADVLALSRIRLTNPLWRAHVQRVVSDWSAADQASALADDIWIEGEPPPPPGTAPARAARRAVPATRARVRHLIDALLDQEPARQAVLRALHALRCELYDVAATSPEAARRRPLRYWNDEYPRRPWRSVMNRLANPYVRRVTTNEMDQVTRLIRAAEQTDLRAAAALLPRLRTGPTENVGVYDADVIDYYRINYPLDAWVSREFEARWQRNAAAVLLAARLYQADHAGQPPSAVNALVPTYLPHVPPDPIRGVAAPAWPLPATRPTTGLTSPPAPQQ